MSRQATKAELQADIAQYRELSAARPVVARILTHLVPAAYDACDRFTSVEMGEGDRLAVYGWITPRAFSIDLLIAQIGSGAGESVMDVEYIDADTFVSRWNQIPADGSEYKLGYKCAAERVGHWLYHIGAGNNCACDRCRKI